MGKNALGRGKKEGREEKGGGGEENGDTCVICDTEVYNPVLADVMK